MPDPREDWMQPDMFRAPLEICWQFTYDVSQEKLDNLYRKAKQSQWDAEEKIDWNVDIDPSRPIIDNAIQAFGAAGVTSDFGLARTWASMRTLRLADGPDEVHRRTIAGIEFKKQAKRAGIEL